MKTNRQMRKDCFHYMKGVIVADYFAQWLQILLPTINAFLIGEMADYLIDLNMSGIINTLPRFILAMIVTVLLVPIFVMLEYIYMTKCGFKYDAYMMGRFLKKPLRDVERTDSGEIMERLSGDLGDYSWNTVFVYDIPMILVTYLVIVAFLFVKHKIPLVYAGVIIMIPAVAVLKSALTAGKKAKYARRAAEYDETRRTSENNLFLSRDFVNNNKLIKLLMRYYDNDFAEYWEENGKKKAGFTGRNTGYDFIIKQIPTLAIVVLGSYFSYKGYMSVGMIFTATLVLPMIEQWYSYAGNYIEQIKATPEYVDRLELFYGEIEDESQEIENDARLTELIGEDLSFEYEEEMGPVITNQSFELIKGTVKRITGKNGSGKSTLMSLAAGLYPPTSGIIKTGTNKKLRLKDLRKHVSLLEQNWTIFSGTIRDNLFVEEENVPKIMHIFELLHMDKALDYMVEPGGANLSPGEQKKILIARAIIKKADFYIFDEPFNHLDDKGKAGFTELIEGNDKGIAIVSHQ
ncbi:MAG: ABC transporter ATP-binding protein [Lachnospiraceae bacterium]|nr:ABC transporter ATP-binding protein [Lachnospiraceae bacterium]